MLKRILPLILLATAIQCHAQWYRLDVDTQAPGAEHIIPATFEGNTPFFKVGFFNDQVAASLSNEWSMNFWYSKNSSTASGTQIGGTWSSNNLCEFKGETNVFFRASKYYFSVVGIHSSGYVKTFGKGTMYQEYDPGADTNLQSIIGGINASWWTNNVGAQVTSNTASLAINTAAITSNDSDITSLQSQITSNDTDITSLQSQITSNDTDIAALDVRVTSNEVNIAANLLNAGTGIDITANSVSVNAASQASLVLADSSVQDNDTGLTLGGNMTSTGTLDAYEGITLREGVAEDLGSGWDGDNNTPRKTDILAAIDTTGTTPNFSAYDLASTLYVEDAITARGTGPGTNTYGASWSNSFTAAMQSNLYAVVIQDGSTTNDRSVYKISTTEYVEDMNESRGWGSVSNQVQSDIVLLEAKTNLVAYLANRQTFTGTNTFTAGIFGLSATTVVQVAGTNFLHSTGINNLFMGANAGALTTSGVGKNTGIGNTALRFISSGDNNTAVGNDSMESLTTGSKNVALGSTSAQSLVDGNRNFALGYATLLSMTSGDDNLAIGANAGRSVVEGYDNVFIGSSAGYNALQNTQPDNSIAIGSDAFTTKSNQVVLGSSAIVETLLSGNVGIGTTSPEAKLDVSGDVLIDSGEYLSWGTAGATSIEGSTASDKLQFRTSNTDRMIINDTGVGIGTTSPSSTLDVVGSIEATSYNFGSRSTNIDIALAGSTAWTYLYNNYYYDSGAKYSMDGGAGAIHFGVSSQPGNILFKTAPTGIASNAVALTTRMIIEEEGNVGVGTDAPATLLHISGGKLANYLRIESEDTSPAYNEILGAVEFAVNDVSDQGVAAKIIAVGEGTTGQAGLGFYTGDPTLLEERVRIDELGNVGIGTDSPSETFHVLADDGKVRISDTETNTQSVTAQLQFFAGAATEQVGTVGFTSAGDSNLEIRNYLSGHIEFWTDNTRQMILDETGQLGIGTTTPDAELEIVGDLHVSNDIIINISTNNNTTGWLEFADEGIQNSEGNFRIGVVNGRFYFQRRGVASWSTAFSAR